MTKAERLEELKSEKQLHKAFDKVMDAGWKAFVDDVRARNALSNVRTFNILNQLKGKDFVKDLKGFMRSTKTEHTQILFTKKPAGILMKDRRYKNIPELMVDQQQISIYGDIPCGFIYIKITDNRWVKIHYALLKK